MSNNGNWFQRAKAFLGEVKAEWGKVTSPKRQEVISTTVVVVVTSFIFALYLWLADTVILQIYEGIFAILDKASNVF